ncbi:MAG: dihydroorotase [Thiohalomonadales bacterium]
MNIVIRDGRIVDPANKIDTVEDIYLADKIIIARGARPDGFQIELEIDATGKIVCPGLVDLSVRLREPGYKAKGSIATETKAAVSGGVTTVCYPPDTIPVVDSAAVVEWIHQRAVQAGFAKVLPYGALTQGLLSEHIAEMWVLKQAGCVGMSNAYKPVKTEIMRRSMEYAASHDITLFLHAEESSLSANGCVHEGVVSTRLGLGGIPEAAETVALGRDLNLIELTGARSHFCHISSANAVKMIAAAQADGLPVTADVTIFHLYLTEIDIGNFNTQCNVRPPLRTQRDLEGLRAGLISNTLSAICSDHQPHDIDAKLAPFPSSEPGISSIEGLLPLCLRLVDEPLFSLSEALSRVTINPAKILGIEAGTLSIGMPADVCIFDPTKYWQLSQESMFSHGKNTPFMGWDLKGQVTHTFVDGRLVFQQDAHSGGPL